MMGHPFRLQIGVAILSCVSSQCANAQNLLGTHGSTTRTRETHFTRPSDSISADEPIEFENSPLASDELLYLKELTCAAEDAADKNKNLTQMLEDISKYVPGVGSAMRDYFEITGINNSYKSTLRLGVSNQGISSFYENAFEKDASLRSAAQEFYLELQNVDDKNVDIRKEKVSIDLKSLNAGLKPGWVWDLALEKAQGDPNRAMKIIGFCGHDDMSRSLNYVPASAEAANAFLREKDERYIKSRKKIIATHYPESPQAHIAKQAIEFTRGQAAKRTVEDDLRISGETDICPTATSSFYYPESLGAGVDISKSMKKEIQEKQVENVKAKYYHIYGSAGIACEMIERGHSPKVVERLQQLAVWSYRTLRITNEFCGQPQENPARADAAALLNRDYLGGEKRTAESWRFAPFTLVGFLERKISSPMKVTIQPEMPQTNIKRPFARDIKPEGWSDERYLAAKKQLESVLIDWEWSMEQHRLGAQFAAEHCKHIPKFIR